MRTILHFHISKEDNSYSASCVEYAIVTQADSLDELVENIQEATELHLEVEAETDPAKVQTPLLSLSFDFMQPQHA
jgi:predicted RNase H-like HicB family nuclease